MSTTSFSYVSSTHHPAIAALLYLPPSLPPTLRPALIVPLASTYYPVRVSVTATHLVGEHHLVLIREQPGWVMWFNQAHLATSSRMWFNQALRAFDQCAPPPCCAYQAPSPLPLAQTYTRTDTRVYVAQTHPPGW